MKHALYPKPVRGKTGKRALGKVTAFCRIRYVRASNPAVFPAESLEGESKVPTTLTTTYYAPPECGGPWLQPFRPFDSAEEVRRCERAAVRRLQVPRNTPVHLRIVAHAIIENQPETAVWAAQVDPREYLALYETAQVVLGHPHKILTTPSPNTGLQPAAIARSWSESASAPRPAAQSTPREAFPVALLGDPLLGRELFSFLESRRCAIVFRQVDFDGHPLRSGPSRSLPLALLPLETRMSCYREVLPLLRAKAAVVVHSPFSHNAALWKCHGPSFGVPLLQLECAIPGFLTGAEKIRLENWLSIHAKTLPTF